jgi:GNAT superfamily N-acetyltransferase
MSQLQPEEYSRVAPLFAAYDYDRCLLGGVLEQRQKGFVFCDDPSAPTCAALFHPGDYGYLAGDPAAGDLGALLQHETAAAGVDMANQELFVPRETDWIGRLRERFGDRLQRGGYEYFTFTAARADWIQRWRERVPEGMRVLPMDVDFARRAQTEKTLQVATGANWGSHERFVEQGFGFVVVAGADKLVAAISSFAVGEGEAEVDITTAKDYRRQGLASLLGAAFTEHCLAHELTPSWTANYGNAGSAATARALGFVDRFTLPCFTIAPT